MVPCWRVQNCTGVGKNAELCARKSARSRSCMVSQASHRRRSCPNSPCSPYGSRGPNESFLSCLRFGVPLDNPPIEKPKCREARAHNGWRLPFPTSLQRQIHLAGYRSRVVLIHEARFSLLTPEHMSRRHRSTLPSLLGRRSCIYEENRVALFHDQILGAGSRIPAYRIHAHGSPTKDKTKEKYTNGCE